MATKRTNRRPNTPKNNKPPKPFVPPQVTTKPRDRYLDVVKRDHLPQDIKSALAGTINGNMVDQTKLVGSMCDLWPRFQTNMGDMQEAMATCGVKMTPFTPDADAEPSSSAIEKANFVRDALANMRENPKRNEFGLDGLVKQIVFGFYSGLQMTEIYYEMKPGPLPYACKPVPPRFYGYPSIAPPDVGGDHLRLYPEGIITGPGEEISDDVFVVARRGSYFGHPTVTAPFRAMVGYFIAATYGLEWFLKYCELFGVPFRKATVADSKEDTIAAVGTMMENLGNAGWGVFPQGTDIEMMQAGISAQSIPQNVLIALADKKCDIWFTGETLTTDEGASGSRSLGQVHEREKLKRKQALASFCSRVLQQVVNAIMRLNYGNTDEAPCPCIKVPTPANDLESAQRMSIILNDVRAPLGNKWVYENIDAPMPEEGEVLFKQLPPPAPAVAPGAGGDDKDKDKDSEGTEKTEE